AENRLLLTCHSTTVIYKTRVRSLIFRLATLAYHRRILFTDFFSQSFPMNLQIQKTHDEFMDKMGLNPKI
ncbi:hypothetical protein, partial [Fusicatenibacter saccharivorans]|uniref:hypothetical protein n=1 Tax=Fusicatenibacter saccharivorans TaxID=1150298 RepID=UPI001A9B55AD